MTATGFNLLLTVSGPSKLIGYLAFTIDTFTDADDFLDIIWAAAALELGRSGETETALRNEIHAGGPSTYALVCSRPEDTIAQGKWSWHLKSEFNCAREISVITKWFPELDIVVVEQQVAPTVGPLLYLTYYTGARHIEYRMSKSEVSRRAAPGPRTPPPCSQTIEPRAVRSPGAVRA